MTWTVLKTFNVESKNISFQAVQIKSHLIAGKRKQVGLKGKEHLFHLFICSILLNQTSEHYTASDDRIITKKTRTWCYNNMTHQTVINTSYSHLWLTFVNTYTGPDYSGHGNVKNVKNLYSVYFVSTVWPSAFHSVACLNGFVLHYGAFTTTQWLLMRLDTGDIHTQLKQILILAVKAVNKVCV